MKRSYFFNVNQVAKANGNARMNKVGKKGEEKHRVVTAPQSSGLVSQTQPNRQLSVRLEEDEDVQWIWTRSPDGQQYVSGYTIVKRSGDN